MEIAAANEHAVGAGVGIEPAGEREGGFDEEELAVGIPRADGEGGEFAGDSEEEEDDEPLVVEVVAEAGFAVEVGDGRGGAEAAGGRGGGGGEEEGFVLPDVVGN